MDYLTTLVLWFISILFIWLAFWKDWKKLTNFQVWALIFCLSLCLICFATYVFN